MAKLQLMRAGLLDREVTVQARLGRVDGVQSLRCAIPEKVMVSDCPPSKWSGGKEKAGT